MDVQIDFASDADISVIKDKLAKLYLELGEEKESIQFLTEALISRVLSNGKTLVLKARVAPNGVLGILTLTESQAIYAGGFYGVIDEMYVDPEFRSKEIGKKLVQKSIEIAKERGWKRIDVTAPTDGNKRTVRFYEKNGFVFTGPKLKYSFM